MGSADPAMSENEAIKMMAGVLPMLKRWQK
jgi:hypothetical protein